MLPPKKNMFKYINQNVKPIIHSNIPKKNNNIIIKYIYFTIIYFIKKNIIIIGG